MKLEELYLTEAMSIPDVDIDDAVPDDDTILVTKVIEGVKYEFRFYRARSDAARMAGGNGNYWAFNFRIAPKARKDNEENKDESNRAFKLQHMNKGLEFKVIPLAMGYITSFLKKYKPQAFMFAADKGENSRVSLYRKIVNKHEGTLDSLGYHRISDAAASIDGTNDLQSFIFFNKDLKKNANQ